MYAENWLTGEATTAMLPEQEGAYVRLMCYAWLATPPCTVPDDDKVLAYVSKLGTRWRKLGAAVKTRFEPIGEGRLREPRLFALFEARAAYKVLQQSKGLKGGRPKADTKPRLDAGIYFGKADEKPAGDKTQVVSVSDSVSKEEPNPSLVGGGSGGNGHRNHDAPLWTQRAFQYKADKIADFIKRAKRVDRTGPGEADFDVAFENEFQMTYERWIEEREWHEAHFRRAQ